MTIPDNYPRCFRRWNWSWLLFSRWKNVALRFLICTLTEVFSGHFLYSLSPWLLPSLKWGYNWIWSISRRSNFCQFPSSSRFSLEKQWRALRIFCHNFKFIKKSKYYPTMSRKTEQIFIHYKVSIDIKDMCQSIPAAPMFPGLTHEHLHFFLRGWQIPGAGTLNSQITSAADRSSNAPLPGIVPNPPDYTNSHPLPSRIVPLSAF